MNDTVWRCRKGDLLQDFLHCLWLPLLFVKGLKLETILNISQKILTDFVFSLAKILWCFFFLKVVEVVERSLCLRC